MGVGGCAFGNTNPHPDPLPGRERERRGPPRRIGAGTWPRCHPERAVVSRFRFGMPTLIEFRGLEANVALCRELELSFVELNMNLPDFSPENLPAVRECHLASGVYFTPPDHRVWLYEKHREVFLSNLEPPVQWLNERGLR